MANAFKLATTLPPFLFDANSSMALAPVVSATYEPADFEKKMNTQGHLTRLEAINRAVMSGKRDLADNIVADVKSRIETYHQTNMKNMPQVQSAMPLLGMSSLKSATMKHSQNAMSE